MPLTKHTTVTHQANVKELAVTKLIVFPPRVGCVLAKKLAMNTLQRLKPTATCAFCACA